MSSPSAAPLQPTSARLVAEIAAAGLRELQLPSRPLGDDEWAIFVEDLRLERLFGFAQAAIGSESLRATDAQASEIAAFHHRWMNVALQIEVELLDVVDLFEAAGIESRVIKGTAVAHLDYPEPSLRSFSDVDLLVRSDDIARAVELVGDLSMRRDLPERGRGFDRRFAKDVTLQGGGRVEVDLHRTIVLGPFGFTVDLAQLWALSEPFELGGVQLRALDRSCRFMQAALTAVCNDPEPPLRTLRDIAQIAWGGLDVDAVRRLATAWRAEAVVGAAVRLCRSNLGDVLPESVALLGSETGDRWQRRAMAAYGTAGGSNTATLLAGSLGLAWRDRATYLRMLVLPSRAYRRARRAARRPREWSTGLRELLHARTRG